MDKEKNNLAFIDGQNLYLGTKETGLNVDLEKFKVYLQNKYDVKEAYYFIGYLQEENNELYKEIQKAGFIVIFKDHNEYAISKKKGNVDTDIVFEIMKNLIENTDFDKIVLVSGDGDYKKLVDYLIEKDRFKRILFPNGNKASSLYNKLNNKFKLSLDRQTVRQFIEKR
jgi:uncharacterized LabA/DUF88 family protein